MFESLLNKVADLISLVNVIKSEGNCGFGHIYWRNPYAALLKRDSNTGVSL